MNVLCPVREYLGSAAADSARPLDFTAPRVDFPVQATLPAGTGFPLNGD